MLKNCVGLVTGGASGLGRATAARLVREGGRALLVDLPTSEGAQVAEEVGATFVPADVRSEEDVQRAVATCKEKFGRLDLAVNCAALGVAFKVYNHNKGTTIKMEDVENVMRTNVVGTFNVCRLVAAAMHDNTPDGNGNRGVIVNTGGISSFEGETGQSAFAASKGAVAAMTLPLARDLAGVGVRVCTIAPGYFDTKLMASLPANVRKFLSDWVLCPRSLGDPDWFAMAVQDIYRNPYMNGEVVRLDGGLRLMV